jgi:hypothetical protein
MGLRYVFDIDLAVKYGVNEAVFLENLRYWLSRLKANKKNFYDGKYWTYNSVESYKTIYPFWSDNQIRTVIASLLAQGAIQKSNYNATKYDRTLWYTIVDESLITICGKVKMEVKESGNRNPQEHEPIPINNPIENTSKTNGQPSDTGEYAKKFLDFWEVYPRKVNKKGAYRCWKAARGKNLNLDTLVLCAVNYAGSCRAEGTLQRNTMHPTTFLGPDDRWSDYLELVLEDEQGDPGALPLYKVDGIELTPKEKDEVERLMKEGIKYKK